MNRERVLRLGMTLYHLSGLSHDQLIRIVKAKKLYSTHTRAAALRHIVSGAPLDVTLGRPFAERRRRVRCYYGI